MKRVKHFGSTQKAARPHWMQGREKTKGGGRGDDQSASLGAGRGRRDRAASDLASSGQKCSPGVPSPAGRGLGQPSALRDSSISVDQYGRTVRAPLVEENALQEGKKAPRRPQKQTVQRERQEGTNRKVAGNDSRPQKSKESAETVAAGLFDDQELGTPDHEARFYEDGQWYPAFLVHPTARGFRVRFFGYEDDPDQDTDHVDIRKILIAVNIIVSGDDGKRCELFFGRDSTLEELQRAVERATAIPASKQRLFWQGKALTDVASVVFGQGEVKDAATMHLMIRSTEDEDMPLLSSLPSVQARKAKSDVSAGARPAKAKGKGGKKANSGPERWWSSLEGDDVISLEPLAALDYQPFRLPAEDSGGSGGVDAYNYFDGKVLSRYLVSTGNFSHPVSRRALSRGECEKLDDYMRAHNLGEAAVVHAYDLKDDQTDNGQHHLHALQDEAQSILEALFAASTARQAPHRRQLHPPSHAQPLPPPRSSGAGAVSGAGGAEWCGVVDDDDEMAASTERFVQDEAWPTLPQTLPAPPPQPSLVAAASPDGASGVVLSPSPPAEPAPRDTRDAISALLGDGGVVCDFWSEGAAAELANGGERGARTILERQMGGTARDEAFDNEIERVDGLLRSRDERADADETTLEERGFMASKVVALRSTRAEAAFRDGVAALVARGRARRGWRQVGNSAAGAAGGGAVYWWNERSGESKWELSESGGGGERRFQVQEGQWGPRAGFGVSVGMAWLAVPQAVRRKAEKGAANVMDELEQWAQAMGQGGEGGDDPEGGAREEVLVSGSLEGAVLLSASADKPEALRSVEEVEEGGQVCVLGGWVALGESGHDWHDSELGCDEDGGLSGLGIVRVGGALPVAPTVLLTVQRKVQVPRPSVSPVSGVHEMEVQVSMACEQPGSAIRFTLDGSDPRVGAASTAGGVVQTYSGPFKLGEGRFDVRAVGTRHGMADSQVVSSVLIVRRRCHAPTLNPSSGVLKHGQKVVMSTKTWDFLPDCRIHYSLERIHIAADAPSDVIQGFYDKSMTVPSAGQWSLRAVAVHPRMLQSHCTIATLEQLPLEPAADNRPCESGQEQMMAEDEARSSRGIGGAAMVGALVAIIIACSLGVWMALAGNA